jgi:threonine synthase
LIPEGKIAMGKLAQAVVHGAKLLQVDGNFDDCLVLARDLSEHYPVSLVNSVNPYRIEGAEDSGLLKLSIRLDDATDIHTLPVGNAGNITAYWKGYNEYRNDKMSTKLPQMSGFQAAGAAPTRTFQVSPLQSPKQIATAIRIGNPASWDQAIAARDQSRRA